MRWGNLRSFAAPHTARIDAIADSERFASAGVKQAMLNEWATLVFITAAPDRMHDSSLGWNHFKMLLSCVEQVRCAALRHEPAFHPL